jgi:hypothetical protein
MADVKFDVVVHPVSDVVNHAMRFYLTWNGGLDADLAGCRVAGPPAIDGMD